VAAVLTTHEQLVAAAPAAVVVAVWVTMKLVIQQTQTQAPVVAALVRILHLEAMVALEL
jgi:hypothetical protein